MFYSRDILASSGSEFALIWRVGNIGDKLSALSSGDKQGQESDLVKTELLKLCMRVMGDEEKFSIRVSGQLLLGISLVYEYKFRALMQDVKNNYDALRVAERSSDKHTGEHLLEPEEYTAKRDAITLSMNGNAAASKKSVGKSLGNILDTNHQGSVYDGLFVGSSSLFSHCEKLDSHSTNNIFTSFIYSITNNKEAVDESVRESGLITSPKVFTNMGGEFEDKGLSMLGDVEAYMNHGDEDDDFKTTGYAEDNDKEPALALGVVPNTDDFSLANIDVLRNAKSRNATIDQNWRYQDIRIDSSVYREYQNHSNELIHSFVLSVNVNMNAPMQSLSLYNSSMEGTRKRKLELSEEFMQPSCFLSKIAGDKIWRQFNRHPTGNETPNPFRNQHDPSMLGRFYDADLSELRDNPILLPLLNQQQGTIGDYNMLQRLNRSSDIEGIRRDDASRASTSGLVSSFNLDINNISGVSHADKHGSRLGIGNLLNGISEEEEAYGIANGGVYNNQVFDQNPDMLDLDFGNMHNGHYEGDGSYLTMMQQDRDEFNIENEQSVLCSNIIAVLSNNKLNMVTMSDMIGGLYPGPTKRDACKVFHAVLTAATQSKVRVQQHTAYAPIYLSLQPIIQI